MLALCSPAALLRPCGGVRTSHTLSPNALGTVLRPATRCSLRGRQAQQAALRPQAAAASDGGEADDATAQGLAAVQVLDALIDALMAKKNPQELAQVVAENIMSFDQRFWLRLATRSDAAAEPEDKQQLAALAKVVMQLVDVMVKRSSEQLTESTSLLQDILKAAADPQTGEWQLPLAPEQLAAMRAVMRRNPAALDESLLASCYACMRKAAEDKLDGMVALVQKVLQLYACEQLGGQQQGSGSGGDGLVDELLGADEALWGRLIRERYNEGNMSEAAFMESLQRRMETVVLGLPSGSYAQRVQAEYLKELEERAKSAFADLAKTV